MAALTYLDHEFLAWNLPAQLAIPIYLVAASTIVAVMLAPAQAGAQKQPPAFLLFDPAGGFLSPRPHVVAAGARRCCQGWPRFSGHRRLGLYSIEHDGKLNRSGRLFLVVVFVVVVAVRLSDR